MLTDWRQRREWQLKWEMHLWYARLECPQWENLLFRELSGNKRILIAIFFLKYIKQPIFIKLKYFKVRQCLNMLVSQFSNRPFQSHIFISRHKYFSNMHIFMKNREKSKARTHVSQRKSTETRVEKFSK